MELMWQAINTVAVLLFGYVTYLNNKQIKDIKVTLNGRLAQLLKLTKDIPKKRVRKGKK